MPIGQYKDFKTCVQKNRGKRNPSAYCATIERNIKKKHTKKNKDEGDHEFR